MKAIPILSDEIENYGERTPAEVVKLLRYWAREHENENYHEYVGPFEDLAKQVESITEPIQFIVMRSPDIFGKAAATFYINPGRST